MAPPENEGGIPDPAVIQGVAVKLPLFYMEQASFWFLQAEAQFILKKVMTSETKYHHLVASLTQEVALQVMPVLDDVTTD